MLKKFQTFINLPASTKYLFAEALFTSAFVKISLLFFPFKHVLKWMGTVHLESEYNANNDTLLLRKNIRAALQLCKKYALWPTECYTLALTGKLLLKRRNIPSTLYIGFLKDAEGKYKGHAWLRANDTYISGYKESVGFNINHIFS